MQGRPGYCDPVDAEAKEAPRAKIERRIGRTSPWEQDEGSPQIIRLPQMRRLRSTMSATTTRKS